MKLAGYSFYPKQPASE